MPSTPHVTLKWIYNERDTDIARLHLGCATEKVYVNTNHGCYDQVKRAYDADKKIQIETTHPSDLFTQYTHVYKLKDKGNEIKCVLVKDSKN